jgi:hypothetical protein
MDPFLTGGNNDKTAKEKKMTPLMRLRYHKAHSGPPMKELHKWMTDQMESRKAEPNSGLGKAISYMLKHWDFGAQLKAPLLLR